MKNFLYIILVTLFWGIVSSCSSENSIVFDIEDIVDSTYEDNDYYHQDTITIAQWNIGNFSNGKSYKTTINSENYYSKKIQYINFIDNIDADILGLCEFNPQFCTNDSVTRDIILAKYQHASIGIKHNYNCNAIFSKKNHLNNSSDVIFKQHAQYRYYRIADINLNNVTVKIIETHLDWNQGDTGALYRKEQIFELIDCFKNFKYVIICADFNIYDITELSPFKEAGYLLSSDFGKEDFKTYPADNLQTAIDNIVVKGFDILDVDIYTDATLSDHCAIKSKLIFKRDIGE